MKDYSTNDLEILSNVDRQWLLKRNDHFNSFDVNVEKHDNLTFELEVTYNNEESLKKKRKKKPMYRVDSYFFFPTNFDLKGHQDRYQQFLQTTTNRFRFKTPAIRPSVFIDDDTPIGPLGILKLYHHELLERKGKLDKEKILEQFRIAANYIIHHSKKLIYTSDIVDPAELERSHLENLWFLQRSIDLFRKTMNDYARFLNDTIPTTVESLYLIDEFLSYSIERYLITLMSQPEVEDFQDLSTLIAEILSEEGHRRSSFTFLLSKFSNEEEQESFIYRMGLLKKFVQKQLYLEVTHSPINEYVSQFAAMGAAGLAAFFAFSVDFWRQGPSAANMQLSTGLVITLLTLTYVLKDRIKEIVRKLVLSKLWGDYDQSRNVHLPGEKSHFARTWELGRLMRREDLDKELLTFRDDGHYRGLEKERLEDIVRYSKKIEINWSKLSKENDASFSEIKEIYRFNLSPLISYLDEPYRFMNLWDREKELIKRRRFPKVYHINVLFQVTPLDRPEKKESYRLRLVVDKQGIKRVEVIRSNKKKRVLFKSSEKVPKTSHKK